MIMKRALPQPNLAAALEHLEWITSHQSPGEFLIRILNSRKKVIETGWFCNRSADLAVGVGDFLKRYLSREVHIFYSVNAFSRQEAKAEYAVPGRLAHVDPDRSVIPPPGPAPS